MVKTFCQYLQDVSLSEWDNNLWETTCCHLCSWALNRFQLITTFFCFMQRESTFRSKLMKIKEERKTEKTNRKKWRTHQIIEFQWIAVFNSGGKKRVGYKYYIRVRWKVHKCSRYLHQKKGSRERERGTRGKKYENLNVICVCVCVCINWAADKCRTLRNLHVSIPFLFSQDKVFWWTKGQIQIKNIFFFNKSRFALRTNEQTNIATRIVLKFIGINLCVYSNSWRLEIFIA